MSEIITGKGIDIHKLIGKLPRPKKGWTLPGHKYTGPYNPLESQLDENDNPLPGQEPYNQVDRISLFHDICYRDAESAEASAATGTGRMSKKECDKKMLISLRDMVPKNMREKFDKFFVSSVIGAKHRLGLGLPKEGLEWVSQKRNWTDQLAEELHKPVRRKFKRRQVISHGIDDIWAADLVEMQPFAKYNKGFKYILTVIDIFSKYAFMVPLKDKKGMSVSKAFSEIFKESGRRPNKVWTDKGREFYNKDVKRLGVPLYSTENEQKSSVVERFNRTLKERMYKYFTANNTNVYFDILDSLVSQYNKSKHRAIKMTPIEASKKKNEGIVHENLYGSKAKTSKAKF